MEPHHYAVVDTPLFMIGDTRTIIAGEAAPLLPAEDVYLIIEGRVEGQPPDPPEDVDQFDSDSGETPPVFQAVIGPYMDGGVEFQDTWEEQGITGDLPLVIGLPSAASGRGPSLLIGGAGRDLLLGGDGNDVLLYALQLFALVDDTGAFRLFDPDDPALLEGATLVHVAEIVVAGGGEDVLVVAAQPAPDQLTISVEPETLDTILLVNGGGNHPN
jgi:hypothetical protein